MTRPMLEGLARIEDQFSSRLFVPEPVRVERRAGDGADAGEYLVGFAAVYDQWATLYEDDELSLREVVRRGAFSAAIAEKQDIRSLFNHDKNFVLGRTASGTLSLRELDRGLYQETRLADSPTIRDLVVTPINRGDITGMSFGFVCRNRGSGQNTNESGDGKVVVKRNGERITMSDQGGQIVCERELLSLDVKDVSPVTYPAYRGTSVGFRGVDLDSLKHELRQQLLDLTRQAPAGRSWSDLASMRVRLEEAG